MNRAVAACWTLFLLSAFLCETVISKGGRGGARGAARGSARGSRTRARFSSSQARVAGAAAAGAAVGLAAGGWYASSQSRSYQSSESLAADDQHGNWTDGDFYSARTSAAPKAFASLLPVLSASCMVSILIYT